MNIRRAAVNAAILQGLALLIGIVTFFVLIPGAGLTPDKWMNNAASSDFAVSHKSLFIIGSLTDFLSAIALPFLALGLYRKFQRSQPGRAVVQAVFSVIASAIFFVSGAINGVGIANMKGATNEAASFSGFVGVQPAIELAAIFAVSVAMWQVCRAAQASRSLSSLTIYAGFLGSVGALGLPLSMISPEIGMMTYISMIGVLVYSFSLAANLASPQKNPELEAAVAS